MTENKTVRLPDGYNGSTMLFYAEPIETQGDTVKLRCAEPGKEFLTAWKYRDQLESEMEHERRTR